MPPIGGVSLFEQFNLVTIKLFLVSDIFSDGCLVPHNRADPISYRSKVQSRHATLPQQFTVDSNGTFALQESHRV